MRPIDVIVCSMIRLCSGYNLFPGWHLIGASTDIGKKKKCSRLLLPRPAMSPVTQLDSIYSKRRIDVISRLCGIRIVYVQNRAYASKSA